MKRLTFANVAWQYTLDSSADPAPQSLLCVCGSRRDTGPGAFVISPFAASLRLITPGAKPASCHWRPRAWSTPLVLVTSIAIIAATAPSASATFPGRDGLIAFSSLDPLAPDGVRAIQPNGSGLRVVVADRDALDPSYSPAGTRIAYSARGELYVARASGRRRRHVRIRGLRAGSFGEPQWLPGGRRLAFTYFHLDDCVDPYCDMSDVIKGFYSVPASGGRPKHIGLDNGSLVGEARPVPSPDGRSVAMLRAASGCPELRVRSGHGRWRVLARGRTKVGRDYRCTLRGFDWAPDSRRLLYVTERPAESNLQAPAGSVTSIWSIRADGRATRRVIELRDASISSAVWSPSGARIAYAATSVTDPDGIYVVARRGGHRRFLAEGAAPTWGVRPARRSSASAARLR